MKDETIGTHDQFGKHTQGVKTTNSHTSPSQRNSERKHLDWWQLTSPKPWGEEPSHEDILRDWWSSIKQLRMPFLWPNFFCLCSWKLSLASWFCPLWCLLGTSWLQWQSGDHWLHWIKIGWIPRGSCGDWTWKDGDGPPRRCPRLKDRRCESGRSG